MPERGLWSAQDALQSLGALEPAGGLCPQARKHGVQGRRQWRKVHLAMDIATSDIRAVEFTPQQRRRQSRAARAAGPDP